MSDLQGYAPPAPQLAPDSKSSLLAIMDPTPTLEILRHEWLGEKPDPKTNTWIKDNTKKQIINEEGISEIFSIIGTSMVNLNTALSNNDFKNISKTLRMIGRLINKQTIVNRADYGIDRSTRATIVMALCVLLQNIFKRSLTIAPTRTLTDKDIIKQVIQQQQVITERPQPKKKFWGGNKNVGVPRY
jgi:hypothetical protein